MTKRFLNNLPLWNRLPFKTRLSVLIVIFLFLSIPLIVTAVKNAGDPRTSAVVCGPGCNWPDLRVTWSKEPYYLIEWCLNTTVRGSAFCDHKNQTGGTSASIQVLDDWKIYWWVDTLLFDPYPNVSWKSYANGSITKNCGGGFRSGLVCNHTITWSLPVHTAIAFHRGSLRDACSGGPSTCRSSRSTTGKSVTFIDLPANQRFDVYIFIRGFLFEILANRQTGSCSCPSQPPPQIPSQPPSSTPPTLKSLRLQISAPHLVGKIKIPLVIGGRSKQIRISRGSKTYNFGVSKDKFVLNEKLTILIGGNKTLVKKFQLRPKKETVTIKVGQLFFGDINGDNKINSVDKTHLLESISNQTDQGDLNFDGVSNSLDWAILLANFGKIGKF